jgi:5-carboxymethyl-2-hydroxymuconate isomerase
MQFILNPEDLDADEVAEISRKAGEILMSSGYIPESTIRDINTWLSQYRTGSNDHTPGDAAP